MHQSVVASSRVAFLGVLAHVSLARLDSDGLIVDLDIKITRLMTGRAARLLKKPYNNFHKTKFFVVEDVAKHNNGRYRI